jgi:hypothetical protein
MLKNVLDCFTFMANPNFLGRAAPQANLAPWEKINRADATPWQRENNTTDAILKQSQKGIPAYQQQKYQQSTEDAWAATLEKERSALEVWANSNNDNNNNNDNNTATTTEPQPAAPGSEAVDAIVNAIDNEEIIRRPPLIPYTIIQQEDDTVRKHRLFPSLSRHVKQEKMDQEVPKQVKPPPEFVEVKRSWPEPRQKNERRMTAANYGAVEIHGFFGLIDDGSDGSGRMLVVHVPRWVKGFHLDIKQGDTIHVYHARGLKIGAALTVLNTGRHKYYSPGRKVTTCTICVPEEQWAPFASLI